MTSTDYVFYSILALMAASIYFLEGISFDLFTIWNITPLLVSLLIYERGRKLARPARLWRTYGFLLGSIALSGYVHLAWFFDWGRMKTGSSTSGLIFIFLPIYAFIVGGIGYFIGKRIANAGKA